VRRALHGERSGIRRWHGWELRLALDAKTGEPLWHAYLGGVNANGPITYAVDGKQYVVGTGGGVMYAFALPH
jgi:outer membrane protein assembly factor BamB